ncbi:MAG TPA: hypothetical protein VGK67_32365 [Myxococcales bacterium]|jgi:hypothetical protein
MAVYLATSQPLAQAERSPLIVEPAAAETAERLHKHLKLPHLYFVASHEGCGCGFIPDQGDAPDEECSLRQASADGLRALVKEAAGLGDAELLVTFDGEESADTDRSRTLEDFDDLVVKWGDRVLWCVPQRAGGESS